MMTSSNCLPPEKSNILADGLAVNKYNTANKLVGVTKGTSNIVYTYSGLCNRLKQIADGIDSDCTLNINAGLTQVLEDNTNKYLTETYESPRSPKSRPVTSCSTPWVPCTRRQICQRI